MRLVARLLLAETGIKQAKEQQETEERVAITEVEPSVLLDFDLLIAVQAERQSEIMAFGLEIRHVPARGSGDVIVQKAKFLLTRQYAENLRNVLNEALSRTDAGMLN